MIPRQVRKFIAYLTARFGRGEPDPRRYVVRIFGKTNDGARYTGTGFLLNSKGYVATCLHVVEKAREIFVQLPYTEEWIYQICAKQELEDLAVLEGHVKPSLATPCATLHRDWFDGSKVGREVALWGYSNAVTAGSSALRFNCHISGVSGKYGLIMLDGHVNPGDSGGPVINADGHVIGIANYKDSVDGHAMARPISRLYELLKAHTHIDFNSRSGAGYIAAQAIASLADPKRKQRVREAAREYTSVFEKASSQVSIIHTHKRVHDLLHEVEFLCYEGLITAAPPAFPEKDWARKQIKIYLFQLKKHLSQVDDILSRITKHQRQVAGVRDQLREAYTALKEADDKLDADLCSCAISRLRDLLWGPDQSNFNVLLNVAARELDMDSLVSAMRSLQGVISKTESSDTAKRFQLGVDDLAQLSKELYLHIDEHDKWQEIDNLLRTFYVNNPELLSQLEFQRKRFMSLLVTTCNMSETMEGQLEAGASASVWTGPLMHEATELDRAVTVGDLNEARLHLGQLRQYVGDRFYETDKKVRELCERISNFEGPLRTVVNNL